ncbi:MAG: hypothetical protein K2W95_15385 [Candidatus Obscuribacterales bacterium]|nr:hypothetical protein [Candidatus Obscuribacterales bacterium]
MHGALEEEFPSQRCPAKVTAGVFRIHSHLDNVGRARRARGNCAAGYSGVIRASLFDGKQWRKFMLARETQVEQRTFSQFGHRGAAARTVLRVLGLLRGKTCVYRDGAFAVDHGIPVPTLAPPSTVAPPTSERAFTPALPLKPLRQGTLWPEEEPSAPAKKSRFKRTGRRGARRRSGNKSDNQPTLF